MKKYALIIAATFLTTAIVSNAAFAAGDAAAGKALFKKKCKICHVVKDNGKNGMGPNLFGVVGRKAGTQDGFTKYSDGMKSAGVWDDAALNKLMEDPAAFVAGNKMKGGKISDAGQRADIIAYLKGLK